MGAVVATRAGNEDWLEQVSEEVLEPELPICDAHHHLWDRRKDYAASRYLLDELGRDLSAGHHIVSTVYIEAHSMYRVDGPAEMRPVGEVEFANGIAAMSASGQYGTTRVAAGIIGFADLLLGATVRPVLEAQMAAAPRRFRGIRCTGAWDADPRIARAPRPGIYLDPSYHQGVAELAKLGLLLEVPCRYLQLPEVTDLARACPGTTIVLNHLGGIVGIGAYAGRRDEIFAAWRGAMAELAKCPNVVVKLGGLGMEYCGFGWHERPKPPTSIELADAYRPYVETAIEQFGSDRCLFESNFPVDRVSSSYSVLWNAFKRLTAGSSSAEKARLFHDTAARVYRLAASTTAT